MNEYLMMWIIIGMAGGVIVGYRIGLLKGIKFCTQKFEELAKKIEEEQEQTYTYWMKRERLHKEIRKSRAYQFLISNYSKCAPYEEVVWRLMTESGFTMDEAKEALKTLVDEGKIRIDNERIVIEEAGGDV